ncbi:DUF2157 domain-containing protein [Marinicella litoralis]|uniref:Putative membrane protein DUF2157 n=1 Tax=Marinicella litoralis TaxID=644220 RepID=A0A4R6XMU4_9GAMM|nr:DUF2157 domain-containing protein [Marinicella litoralis]TDR19430.1 putative membrane protein DUF2157 [Marinicella litoralis]
MSEPIYRWLKSGLIEPGHHQQALQLAGERAAPHAWLLFIKKMLIMLGLLSLAFGVVFFFAFNWNELGRMFKFMVIQTLLVGLFVGYFFKSKSFWLSQALLLAAVIVLGALLALFGQTYQTGADPWQLFAIWGLLITPLVLFSKSEVLWVVLAALLNTALSLYLDVHRSFLGFGFLGRHMPWIYLLLNTSLLLVLEWLSGPKGQRPQSLALPHRWAAQVLGLVVIYIVGLLGLSAIWGNSETSNINLLLFSVFMILAFLFYRRLHKDLLLLTAWSLSMIVFVLALLANTVFHNFDAGGLLLMALCLIGMSTFAVSWLKKTHVSFKQETSS